MAVERGVRYEGRRLVRAPVHRVWHLLSRLESHPRYTDLWLVADLLDRSQGSAVVEFRGYFGGLPVTSVQRVTLRPPSRIEFRQTRGTLRGFGGVYTLRDSDGDTEVGMSVTVDAGIALFSDVAVQQILAAQVDTTLGKIKASAERDLVRIVRRVGQVPGGPPAEPVPVEADSDMAAEEDAADVGTEAEGEAAAAPAVTREGAPSGQRRGRRRRRRRRARGVTPSVPEAP
jgi:hypothetical protein